MPYKNNYNENIARRVKKKDLQYAVDHAFSKIDNLTGGTNFTMGNASKVVNNNDAYAVPSVPLDYYGTRDEIGVGGNGFASGTFRDTGYGSVRGAGEAGEKTYRRGAGVFKILPNETAVLRGSGRPRKEGAGILSGILNIAQHGADIFGLGKHNRKAKDKANIAIKAKDLKAKAKAKALNPSSHSVKKSGTKRQTLSKMDMLVEPRSRAATSRRRFIPTQLLRENNPVQEPMVAAVDANENKGGREQKEPPRRTTQGTKGPRIQVGRRERDENEGSGKPVPMAQLPSVVGGRKPNKRAAIVKKVMKEQGLKMIEASKYVKAHNLY